MIVARQNIRNLFLLLAVVLLCISCSSNNGAFDDASMESPTDNIDNSDGSLPDDDDDAVADDDDGSDDNDTDDDDDDDDDDDNDDNDDDLAPEGDEDRDGISNEQEVVDGTDPLDPSDALSWHPEYTGHPKLIADQDRWLQIKNDILNGDPDAQRLFSRVLSIANRAPSMQEPGIYLFGNDEVNSETALSAAIVAFVNDDPTYATKAIELADTLEFNLLEDLTYTEFDHGTIHGGQAMVEFSLAYDLLAGFDLANDTQQEAMRDRILAYAKNLHRLYIVVPSVQFIPNNHLIKLVCGFGVVGMLFNDIPEAAKYINITMTAGTYILLDFQMPDEGGQGEGPNYLDYTFKSWLFLAAIYHRFANGETYPYKIDCRTRMLPGCSEDVIDVADPVMDERMQLLLDWRLALIMPNGKCPPIDDSNLSCGYSGPIAALYERPDYAWHYRASKDCKENTSNLAAVELAYLNQMPLPALPDFGPSVFMYDGGQAILRSDWGSDADYALINGEHGKARLAGIGHEQPDATSFIFYALGEMFAIDSGYISYDERWHVIHPENHSMILVDDQGPPLGLYWVFVGVDSYLSEFVDDPFLRSVKVNTSYRQADIQRRVMMIDDDYFVTQETVSSDRMRQYAWLMQTNAGGSTDGTFTLQPTGAMIERPGGSMQTYLQSNKGPIEFLEDEKEHGFRHGQIESHAVLRGQLDAEAAEFLGVHVFAQNQIDLPVVDTISSQGMLAYLIQGDDYIDLLIADSENDIVFPSVDTGLPAVESDGDVVWIRMDPIDYSIIEAHQFGGTYLNLSKSN